jgi:hypothetical protein
MSTIKKPPAPSVKIDRTPLQAPVGGPKVEAKQSGDVGGVAGVKRAGLAALDNFDPNKSAPLECGTLAALVKLHEQGKLDEVRKTGAQNMTVLKGLMDDLLSVQKGDAPKNYWVGDIEGREQNNLTPLIESGAIKLDPKGNGSDAKLTEKGARLVFLGDIGDRGGIAMWARRVLTSLHKQDPKNVDIIWGNRCLSKLALLNDLPNLQNVDDKGYRAFLDKKGDGNSVANQVQYWLQEHGARGELEFHRQELSKDLGRDVGLNEAAQHYIDALKPGGEYFEFLRLGNWGVTPDRVDAPVISWHGGASKESIRQVPGSDQIPTSAKQYAQDWSVMGKDLFAEMEASIKKTGRVPPQILSLGESDWDARAGQNRFNASSNTYGMRDKEQGNYRGVSEAVASFYAKDGVHFEPVGHSPVPQLPMPMKSAELGGVTRIYNDTSFTSDGSVALSANKGDLFVMAGRLGDEKTGEIVLWTVKPDEKSPIGLVTNDGFTVRGMTLDGHYALTRYVDGHSIANKKVTPQELAELKPTAISLEKSEEANEGRDQWFQDIAKFEYNVMDHHALNDAIGDRTPIVISAASEYGKLPVSPDEQEKMWSSLLSAFGDKAAYLTGGTNVEKSWKDAEGNVSNVKAPEYVFHELAEKAGRNMVGFIPEQTNTGSIAGELKNLFVAGRKGEWDAPLFTSMNVASEKKGAAIFVGGGGTITKAIDEAAKNPKLQVVLFVSRDVDAKAAQVRAGGEVGTMGASDAAAVQLLAKGKLPANFILAKPGDDVGALLAARLK